MNMRGDAQIAARGFQPYDGPRSGVAGAIRSVSWESIRATLGIGRPARTKIFPVAAVVIAYVPAIVFVGISVLIPGDLLDPNEVADYAGYYGFITLAIILFSALVAPEVLVSDRRNGMLAMYLSTPLHRGTYLTSKAIAVGATLGLVTLFPPILVLLGYTFDGSGPDGFGHWMITLLRIFVSGIAVSAALTSVSMAASSMTDRRAFAAIGIVLIVLISPILANALVEGAGLSPYWWMISLFTMPFELVNRIFGQAGDFPEISTFAVLDGQRRVDGRRAQHRGVAILEAGGRPMSDVPAFAPPSGPPAGSAATIEAAVRPGHRHDRGERRVEVLRLGGRGERRHVRDQRWRHCAPRPERGRQVDAVPDDVRAHRALAGHGAPPRFRPTARPRRARPRVARAPAGCVVRSPERHRVRVDRRADAGRRWARRRRPVGARTGRSRRRRRQAGRRVLQGHAPAGQGGLRAGERPGGAHPRRTAHRARPGPTPTPHRARSTVSATTGDACSCRATCSTR